MSWKTIQSVFCGALLLAAITMTAETPSPEPKPLGKMVDLGGYRIHLYCTGKRQADNRVVAGRRRFFIRLVFGPTTGTDLSAGLLV